MVTEKDNQDEILDALGGIQNELKGIRKKVSGRYGKL